ncbi:hypothetical protein IQ03_00560 [Gemmobacter caeni]|uniref:Fibronectin type-III domain-containing protein n=1 Tax=Gemmobacter caeni TaxID=589035 RepID=A0A2T6A5I2_9RHOB|nr:hypothetical protein [Gemmobacter caeni]PTX39077.1 hypothetical protein C8N34_1399 [Gemmobacter caeni]TWJ05752.1 hypothetical protein IQ03_00560 [Gemmobacter caeni]
MRIRNLALAALLSTTCLAGQAKADPLSAFFTGFWQGLTTGVVAGAGIGGPWALGASAGSWLAGGSLLSRVVLSVGLSALSQALMPTPSVPSPSDRQVNWAQPISYQERVYGRVRKGGPFCFSAASRADVTNPDGTDDRFKRHYGILIAAHSTRGPVQHFLDKRPVELEGDFVSTEPIWYDGKGRWAWHGAIRTYTGQPGQAVDPIWDSVFPEVTTADDFKGLSYAALYAARPPNNVFQRIYPTGREWVYAPVWDGCDTVYDPRTETSDWTDNAALIIADVAQHYGFAVDWDEVAAEADISDQLVTNRDGGTHRRWTINMVIDSSMTWEQVRAEMMKACDAFFYERRDGKLGFKVGYYSAPTVTLTDADFLSISIRDRAWGSDVIGQVAVKYVEPALDYQEELTGAVVADPQGDRHEEPCGAINSHNQGWRVGYRWLATARPPYSVTGTIGPIGYECMEQRFLRITHEEAGFDEVVEVSRLTRNGGSHTFSLDVVSVDAGDFDPDALTLEPARPLRAVVAEDGDVVAPASLTGEAVEGTGGVALIEWAWPVQPEDLRQQLQIRSVDAGVPDWQIVDAGEGQSSLVSTGLVDGATYEAQVRNRTPGGRGSPWYPAVPLAVVAVANSTAPAPLVAFGAAVSGSDAVLTFTAPNDGQYAATRIWRADGSTAFVDAVAIRTEFGAPNAADSYTDVGPGVGSHSYWAEPINGSGIAGPRSGPQTITII